MADKPNANFTPSQDPYKKLIPLNLCQLTNFPFIDETFDSLTYYEFLCKIVEYLNNVIENEKAVTNNTESLLNAYNQLQDYVNHYFDNLDIQEEINNKLNELLEDGTLQNILNNYTNTFRIYNTTLEMIADSENLIEGMKIKTNGYSKINDDGNATFVITNTENSNLVQLKINENLFANIILNNNEININSLGADYSGNNDCSTLLNNLLKFINNQWLNNNNLINTIVFNGTYLIENQIILPPCARLRGKGYTILQTNVENNSAIHITYLSQDLPSNFKGNKQDWLYANLIDFENGGLIKNIGSRIGTTAIEIGTDTNLGQNYPISRYKLCNFRIYNFETALKHNTFNVYMGNYERISFEGNNNNVVYGDSSHTTVYNSGENMNYIQCLFASATNGIVWNCDGFDSYFTGCSFDYIDYVLLVNKGYSNISIINSHIESFKNIINKLNPYSNVNISNCNIVDTQRAQYFNNISNNSHINFEKNKLLFTTTNNYSPEKICQLCTSINYKNNFNAHNDLSTCFINKNNKINNFDKLEDGDISVAVGSKISDLNIISKNDTFISNTAHIVTDNYLYEGHKSLVLEKLAKGGNSMQINIRTSKIPVYSNLISCNAFVKNIKNGMNILVRGYDIEYNLVFQSDNYHNNHPSPNQLSNEWWISEYSKNILLPNYVAYFTVEFQFSNINNSQDDPIGTEYSIGGFIIN